MAKDQDMTDRKMYMDVLRLAGETIMENGGETYRVEETVDRMGRAFGLEEVQSFAVPSGLIISFRLNGDSESSVLRVRRGSTDLERVDQVNQISRLVEAGKMDCARALEQLREIRSRKTGERQYPTILAAGLSAAGFCLMFGGAWMDWIVSAGTVAVQQLFFLWMRRKNLQSMMTVVLGAFLATLIPQALQPVLGLNQEAVIAGALMPLLPGLAMTNAVQDALRGDMISGVSHFTQAIMTAGLVAGGALTATTLLNVMGGVL